MSNARNPWRLTGKVYKESTKTTLCSDETTEDTDLSDEEIVRQIDNLPVIK